MPNIGWNGLPLWLALGVSACAVAGQVHGQQACGDPNAGLRVDYRNPKDAGMLNNINTNHFNENVENLVKGQSGSLAGDLDYVLRNAPNHTRALYAMAKYHLREHTEKFRDESFSIDCWFDRAMRFAPTDASVPMIYGIYLHRKGDLAGSERRYQEALSLDPNFAEGHYDLGLLYVDMRRYDDALAQAHAAYKLGYPLPGLKQKLVSIGRWRDAPAESEVAKGEPPASPR
jgi:Tfp pilus assembly protein PilF